MKTLDRIHQGSDMHWVGNGFPVRSVLDYNGIGRELNPFLLLDHAAPHEFEPGTERRGVGEHPHRGFETVTIAYQGEIEHRDSSGGGGRIGAGDVQWMTAGAGVIHEEFHAEDFTRRGGTFEMVQLWVNLRAQDKNAQPGYQTLLKTDIPHVSLADAAGMVRVIAGELEGRKGPARTFSPIDLWEVNLTAGKSASLPLPEGHVLGILVLRGRVAFEGDREASEGDLGIFNREGDGVGIDAVDDSRLLLMSAEPIDEPIFGHGPFVMNSRAEIEEAFHDYQEGKMGKLPE